VPDGWVVVGRITGAHGVRGEVRVVPETDFPERLARLRNVTLLLADGVLQQVRIASGRPHTGKGTVLLALDGVTTRTDAEGFRGALLLVRPSESPSLSDGQYYEWQIIGLRAVTGEGRDLGVVREVIHTGANDVYVTDRCLLPAVEGVIKQVDLTAGRMVVEPLPGLLD
jgi:16S rRNA processing protein RimM